MCEELYSSGGRFSELYFICEDLFQKYSSVLASICDFCCTFLCKLS
jgi:hypothetical protein